MNSGGINTMNALERMYKRMDARKEYIAYSKAERDRAAKQAEHDFTIKNREKVASRMRMKLPKMKLE